MKIMKVIYKLPQDVSDYDGSNAQYFMGEDSWAVDNYFSGEYVKGTISSISFGEEYGIRIYVKPEGSSNEKLAMWIAPHDVSRIYYGE